MVERLDTCATPGCAGIIESEDQTVCTVCKKPLRSCPVCKTANDVFARYCRRCREELGLVAGTWTCYRQGPGRGAWSSTPGFVGVQGLTCVASEALGSPVNAGALTAFQSLYATTASGIVHEFSQSSLSHARTFPRLAGSDRAFHGTPAIVGQHLCVHGERELDATYLGDGAGSRRLGSVDQGWTIRSGSLLALGDHILVAAFRGSHWKIVGFPAPSAPRDAEPWESDVFEGSAGLTIPALAGECAIVLSGSGGIYSFTSDGTMTANEDSNVNSWLAHVHPVAEHGWVFAASQGRDERYHIMRVNGAPSQLTAESYSDGMTSSPEGIIRLSQGWMVIAASGYVRLSQHGNCIDPSSSPPGVNADAAMAAGDLVVLPSSDRALLHLRAQPEGGGISLRRVNTYVRSTEKKLPPYVSVVAGKDSLFAVRRDGFVEKLVGTTESAESDDE